QQPYQGFAHQRRDRQHAEGAGRRPRPLHPRQPQAGSLGMLDTVAILTGASRGLGDALAHGLVREGTLLITLARTPNAALAAAARAASCELQEHLVDLGEPNATDAAAALIFAHLPRQAKRYLLINNAGTLGPI